MERYFPPGRTDLVFFALEHISHQELLDKMLKDRDEVAVLNPVSCFMWRTFNTHLEFNSSLIFMRENYALFSRGIACKPGQLTHRKFGRTSPQFSRKSDPNVFVFDPFASSVVSTRKTRRHLVAFHD